MTQLLDHRGSPLIAPTRAGGGVMSPAIRTEFMRPTPTGRGGGWKPALRSTADDVESAWDQATARAIDLSQNSGWISGMFDQAVANVVGDGLRLRAAPENDLFGMNEADAKAWRTLVERRWQLWSENPVECDIEGRRTIAQMQDAAFRSWLVTGEILGEMLWRRRFGSDFGTKVRLLSPAALSRTTDPLRRIRAGVRMDNDGFPTGYLASRRDHLGLSWDVMVNARDALGRPRVVHIFEGQPGQVRGITPLVPVIKLAKQFDQLADATLMASLIQTVFAASLQSEEPTEESMRGLLSQQEQAQVAAAGMSPFEAWAEMHAGWYDANSVDVGIGGRIASLFPGEKLEFHTPRHPATAYKEFSGQLLREMARCLGMTYESATGDYTAATYSSVRMAVGEIHRITTRRRKFIVAPFVQPIYAAWLEEEIETGRIPFPGGYARFLANRHAASRAAWLGAPKPQADDLKAAKAHQVYRDMGVITDDQIANDLGHDIEDIYAQRAREAQLRAHYGLPEPTRADGALLPSPEDGEEEEGAVNG